jgi:hypothetical protein
LKTPVSALLSMIYVKVQGGGGARTGDPRFVLVKRIG